MPRRRKTVLNCLELRVHLCEKAQKCTECCLKCLHPCPNGEEYAQRFLRRMAGADGKRNRYLEALTKTYVEHQEHSKTPLIKLVPQVACVGICNVHDLRNAWKKEHDAMKAYAKQMGMDFPEPKRLSNWESWEERVKAYRGRLAKYDAMLAKGMTWTEIAEAEGQTRQCIRERYRAAQRAVKEDQERQKAKNGIFCY